MKNKIYFSYQTRLIANIVILVLSSVLSILLLAHSFNLFEKTEIYFSISALFHKAWMLLEVDIFIMFND